MSGAYRPLFSSAWAERRLGERLARSIVLDLPRPARTLFPPACGWKMSILLPARGWLFEGGGLEALPERVRDTIRRQQERSEILIGWAQLALVALLATA